jgi:hypothetical protein
MTDLCSVEECSVHSERAQNYAFQPARLLLIYEGHTSETPRPRPISQGVSFSHGSGVFSLFPARVTCSPLLVQRISIDHVNQHLCKMREDRFRSVEGVLDPLPPPLQLSGFKCGLGADGKCGKHPFSDLFSIDAHV